MKLYTSPLACSSAAHMALLELDVPHEVVFVDIYAQPHRIVDSGTPYATVNPKDAVPALELDSGEILTEVSVILQYVCASKGNTTLLPPAETFARYRVLEWLSFIGSDVHKTIGPLFNPAMPDAAKHIHQRNLARRLSYVERQLGRTPFLTGETLTIADLYLFVMTGWEPYFKFALAPYPELQRFHARVRQRPSFARLLELITPALGKMTLPVFPT